MSGIDHRNAYDLIAVSSLRSLQHDDVIQANAAQSAEKSVAVSRQRYIAGPPRSRGSGDVANGLAQRAFIVAFGNHGRESDARNGDLAEGMARLEVASHRRVALLQCLQSFRLCDLKRNNAQGCHYKPARCQSTRQPKEMFQTTKIRMPPVMSDRIVVRLRMIAIEGLPAVAPRTAGGRRVVAGTSPSRQLRAQGQPQ